MRYALVGLWATGGRADGGRGHGSVEQRRDEEIGKTKVSKTLYNGDGGRGNASEPKAKRTAIFLAQRTDSRLGIWGKGAGKEDDLPA